MLCRHAASGWASLRRRWSSRSCVFTGFQPSGSGAGLHLGNYLGAIRPFLRLQAEQQFDDVFLSIVDLHALTSSAVAAEQRRVRGNAEEMFATALACGVDTQRTVLYLQSDVAAHAELFWLLNCRTPVHLLNQMTQWKQKKWKAGEHSNAGLYTYPVLMAADILLYGATHVPVGDDQVQHIELTRKLVDVFNEPGQPPVFQRPQFVLSSTAARVMDLRDAAVKMSKSSGSDASRINLSDGADAIADKLRRAKTDSLPGPITYDPDARPELANLLRIYAALTDATPADVAHQFADHGFARLKAALTEVLVDTLLPIGRATQQLLRDDRTELRALIRRGADRATALAQPRIKQYKAAILGGPID